MAEAVAVAVVVVSAIVMASATKTVTRTVAEVVATADAKNMVVEMDRKDESNNNSGNDNDNNHSDGNNGFSAAAADGGLPDGSGFTQNMALPAPGPGEYYPTADMNLDVQADLITSSYPPRDEMSDVQWDM